MNRIECAYDVLAAAWADPDYQCGSEHILAGGGAGCWVSSVAMELLVLDERMHEEAQDAIDMARRDLPAEMCECATTADRLEAGRWLVLRAMSLACTPKGAGK